MWTNKSRIVGQLEFLVPASHTLTCNWLTRAVAHEIKKLHPNCKSITRIVALKTSEGHEALDFWLTLGENFISEALEDGEQLELVLS